MDGQGAAAAGERSRLDDAGYVLVALLVGMAVAAIWLGAALPAWRQQALRQKEEELIFRGEQYARAIVLYQKKNQGVYPQSIDTLVSDRYLRKKWKDPVTGKDFITIGIGQPTQSTPARGTPPAGQQQQPGRAGGPVQQVGQVPGITGVRSTSQATSIKIYRQQQQHSLWPFDAAQLYAKMGYSPAAQNRGDGRGGPGRAGDGRGGPARGGPVGPGGRPGGDGRGGPGRGDAGRGGPGRQDQVIRAPGRGRG